MVELLFFLHNSTTILVFFSFSVISISILLFDARAWVQNVQITSSSSTQMCYGHWVSKLVVFKSTIEIISIWLITKDYSLLNVINNKDLMQKCLCTMLNDQMDISTHGPPMEANWVSYCLLLSDKITTHEGSFHDLDWNPINMSLQILLHALFHVLQSWKTTLAYNLNTNFS